MTEDEKKLLVTYARCDMSAMQTAVKMQCHHNTINYRLDKVHRKYNINPRNFYGLVKLLRIAGGAGQR